MRGADPSRGLRWLTLPKLSAESETLPSSLTAPDNTMGPLLAQKNMCLPSLFSYRIVNFPSPPLKFYASFIGSIENLYNPRMSSTSWTNL